MKRLLAVLLIVLGIAVWSGLNRSEPALSQDAAGSLRQHAESLGFYVGTAARDEAVMQDADYRYIMAREFNALSPENELKFKFLSPSYGRYNFAAADRLMAYAEANNMMVRGLPLIWHLGDPSWVRSGQYSPAALRQIFTDHISRVITRYGDRIPVWGVVNEAFLYDGSLRNSIWRQNLGDSYIEEAFHLAHAANPNALLFIDDFGNEGLNTKSNAMYNFLAGLVTRGVPVHGIGFQMHVRLDQPPDLAAMATNIQRYGELGLQVHITELDVRVQDISGTDAEKQARQAEMYQSVLDVCLRHSNCTAFITWGFTDRYTWIPGYTGHDDTPLLFDASYNAKPAYFAVREMLAQYAGNVPPSIPEGPAVVVNTETDNSDQNVLRVHFDLHNVSAVYGLEVHCQADPSALVGQTYGAGDGFTDDNSLFVDTGFDTTAGDWSVAVSRMRPAPGLDGDLRAFSLEYAIRSAGSRTVDCRVLAVDANGYVLPLDVINGSAHVSTNQDMIVAAQSVMPASDTTLVQNSTITGIAMHQHGSNYSGITALLLQGGTVVAESSTDMSGRYVFSDVPAGQYRLLLTAPAHLSQAHEIDIQNQQIDLGISQLLAGDIDGNAVVDVLDAALIGANFLLTVPPGPDHADLTRDNLIDVRDLVVVGLNLGNTGSQ